MKHPMIKDHRTAVVVGWGVLILGFVLLYDAYDGRGHKKPWPAGPILPW